MFESPGGSQIHDFNPGIEDNGLFWTSRINPRSVLANPGSGRASMRVRNLASRDFHDLGNALAEGPSLPAVVSFDIQWTASNDMHHFHHEPGAWDADVVFNAACRSTGDPLRTVASTSAIATRTFTSPFGSGCATES